MTLNVDELHDGIVFPQNFRIRRSMNVSHIRPWIIKWQNPVGELVVQVLQDDELLAESVRTATEIAAEIPGTFFHGFIRFDFESLQLNHDRENEWTEYEIRVFTRNSGFDNQNFFGTIRQYELKIYDTYGNGVIDNEAPNDMVEPLGFEIYEREY